MEISKKHRKWLMDNKLHIKMPVVKKNHFEKQTQI
jgi:hypothetical protein